jgi:enamine deaminase RidA (YjgF/YER057c/UK114 family)
VAHPPAGLNGSVANRPLSGATPALPDRLRQTRISQSQNPSLARRPLLGRVTTSVVVLSRCGASLIALLVVLIPARAFPQATGNTYINPRGLVTPTGYTHVVVAADRRTIYIAGQVAFDSTGKLVGESDFAAQAEQVFTNLGRALGSVGASFGDVVKMTTLITDVKNVPALREIRARYLDPKQPPANTLVVAHLVRPELLLEIEAVAVLTRPLTRGR